MNRVRPCGDQEIESILGIINDAAQAYRGAIPPDRWHDPYMSEAELRRDMSAGVEFWGYESGGELIGGVDDGRLLRAAPLLGLGDSGHDLLDGGAGSDLLRDEDDDELRGGRGHDQLDRGAGRDPLKGGRGDDQLSGGPGRDLLRGGRGRAVLHTL